MKIFTRTISAISLFIIFSSCSKDELTVNHEEEVVIESKVLKEKELEYDVYEIIIDNSEDVDLTIMIQEQIDAIPDGKTGKPNIIRFPEGRFWTEGNLENNPKGLKPVIHFLNRHNLIIEGANPEKPTTFFTKAPAIPWGGSVGKNMYSKRRHFSVEESTNIIVRHIRIEGSNRIKGELLGTAPEYTPEFWGGGPDKGSGGEAHGYVGYWELEHAFEVKDSKHVLLDRVEAYGVWGDGLYIGNSTGNPSEYITIKDSYLGFVGRQGIAMANCRNILVDNVHIEWGRRADIDMEPFSSDGFVEHVEIKNCVLESLMTTFAMGGRGQKNYIDIHHNEFKRGGTISVYDSKQENVSTDIKIRFNRRTGGAFGSPASMMGFRQVRDVLIEGNIDHVAHSQSKKIGFFTDCEGSLVIKDNDFGAGDNITVRNSFDSIELVGNNNEITIVQ